MSEDRERYEIERLPDEGPRPGLYVLRDTKTGKLLADAEGTLVTFTIRSSAADWRQSLSRYEEAGYGCR